MEKNKAHWIMVVVSVILFVFLIFYVLPLITNPKPSYNVGDFQMEYLGLNKTEINLIEDVTWDLESYYKKLAKRVIIFKGFNLLNKTQDWVEYYGVGWRGLNINNGEEIYLLYSEDLCELRVNLCHELLHSLFDEKQVYNEEDFTYIMSERHICYANTNCEMIDSKVSIYTSKTDFIECKDSQLKKVEEV